MRTLSIFKILLVVMLARNTHQWGLFNWVADVVTFPAKAVISTIKHSVEAVVKIFDPHMRGKIYIDGNYVSECRMKPFQNDHGLELYDCTNPSYHMLTPWRFHGSLHFPHVQFYSMDSDINLLKLEGSVKVKYYRTNGSLAEFKMQYSIFDSGAFNKIKSSMNSKVLSVKPPYNNAKSSSSTLCNTLNEKVRQINAFKRDELKNHEQALVENNKKLRELEQQISELNSMIDEKNIELEIARKEKDEANAVLQNKVNERSKVRKEIEDNNQKKIRLVKVSKGELNSDAEHQMLSQKEKTRCRYLKYQDAIEMLVPFETQRTQCSMKEIVENVNFEKGKQCIEDIVS